MGVLDGSYISTPEKTLRILGGIVFPKEATEIGKTEDGQPIIEEITEEEAKAVEYEDGKGYVDGDGYIWIFCLNKPAKACRNEYPYFWRNKTMDLEFSEPTEAIRDTYSIENVKSLELSAIINETEDYEQLFDEEEINDVNAATSFYVPLLRSSDDALKKAIKAIIIRSGTDINRLKVKTEQKYVLPNMRSVLDGDTKMSTTNFNRWMDLLGCVFDIIIRNDGTDSQTLRNPIIYQSQNDTLGEIVNGEIIELNSGSFVLDQDQLKDE